jgi:hypothetical protein
MLFEVFAFCDYKKVFLECRSKASAAQASLRTPLTKTVLLTFQHIVR